MSRKEIIDKVVEELFKMDYQSDFSNYRHSVISEEHRPLTVSVVSIIINDMYDSSLGELEAKVFAYEKIISNSNFKPILEEKGE